MDGRTLMEIMQSPNFSMWAPAEQAFNLDQQKRQADLASMMGQEQRAQQMLPLEMEQKRQAARMSGGQADIYRRQLDVAPPVEDERKANMQKMLAQMDETTKAQFKAQVTRNMQIAAMAKANKGMLPEGLQLSPEEIKIFDPKNLDAIIKHGQTFLEFDPEEISKRQRAAEAERLARVRGDVQKDVKTTPPPSKGGEAPATVPQTYAEIIAGMQKLKKASERLAYLKTVLPAVPPELAEQLRPAYNGLRAQAEAEANARTAGQVDIAATTKGKVPVTPPVNLGDAPSAVTNRPARQQATEAPKYTQADLEFTAKKYNMTVEQVKKQLGIK
jgi:hypothetical protein